MKIVYYSQIKLKSIALIMTILIASLSFSGIVQALPSTNTIIYDSNGNRVQDSSLYYEYNNFNQLARVRNGTANGTVVEEYVYDHEGNRVIKREPLRNQTTYYAGRNFVRVVNLSGTFDTVYVYDEKDLVARRDPDGKKFFYHPDHLGSTTLVTNETGHLVEETTYEPYGLILAGGSDRYDYTGKELDIGTGLEYYGARYYDPTYAQFAQPDSVIPDAYDPQQLNRYAYVRDNPYKYTDPDGNQVSLAIDTPFTLLGESSVGWSSQGIQLLGRNEVILRDTFRNSKLAQELKDAGYKSIDEFSRNSPIHQVADKWKWGGMAKELENGRWSGIRWDIGPTPESPTPVPHVNQQLFRPSSSGLEQVIEGTKLIKDPLDHFPLFSASTITQNSGSDGYSTNVQDSSSSQSSNSKNSDQNNKNHNNNCGFLCGLYKFLLGNNKVGNSKNKIL